MALSFYLRRHVADPQSGFLADLAAVGATFFIAFVVETSAATLWLTKDTADDESLSGETVGLGLCAFLGVAIAIALSNHGPAHNLTWLEEIGFAWSIVSLFMLGAIVAAFPLLHYEQKRRRSARKTVEST